MSSSASSPMQKFVTVVLLRQDVFNRLVICIRADSFHWRVYLYRAHYNILDTFIQYVV